MDFISYHWRALSPIRSVMLTAICTFLLIQTMYGNNGHVAYAYSIDPIKVDGNLSDWPNHLKSYPINSFHFNNQPKSDQDYSGSYKVAYHLESQKLFIGIEVIDDSYFIDTSKSVAWDSQDAHLLYLDPKHSARGSAGLLYIIGNNFSEITGNQRSWDPDANQANWDNIEYKISRTGTTTTYEWSIFLGENIFSGNVIGLDHVIIDKDEEDQNKDFSFISWGPTTGKSSSAARLADVVLVPDESYLGTAKGKIQWTTGIEHRLPRRIRLEKQDLPKCHIDVNVDSLGNYSAKLPSGVYSPILPYPFYGNNSLAVKTHSQITSGIKKQVTTNVPTFIVQTKPLPNISIEKGLLPNYKPSDSLYVDDFIETYMNFYNIPGVSMALIKDNKVAYYKTYGVSNAYTQKPLTENTLFEAASITKSVFAFAVNRLVERGELDLDKPLYEYLPFEAIAHDDRYKLITARIVLCHQTGFPNWAWMNDDGKIDIKFTPGTGYGYSGEGFEYLGRVVAHITGKDLNTFLKEEILEPFNLYNTHFSDNPELEKVAAYGHFDNFPTRLFIPNEPGMAHSMYTEAKAFTNFMIGLLKQKHLSANQYEKMFSNQSTIPPPKEVDENDLNWKENFGLGFHLVDSPYGKGIGHGGNNGDFQCIYRIFPDHKMGFVLFANNDFGGELHSEFQKFLLFGKNQKKDAEVSAKNK